ncbi:PQQ-dependent sugar dehydrogenase [Pseudohalioglobus lutimaris]|uniref:PQQ-dependent sugar dehydrogenase n=1 Tax=Pseudohalioglobus lutimaris TaxID=1737061 RepID=A0A2N5WY00_9GAMM|nr:PQQ-dependent sugar dehydrogenase [Pseudohalioglobus lutimaris]PLW67112.1 PQQ-dependent sugar dehydrogenase [Pseudohalioglobus lutimaris]
MNHCLARPFKRLVAAVALFCLAGAVLAADYELTTVARDMDEPWSVAQLPDGEFLVTLRGGKLLRISEGGAATDVQGAPETYYAGQGGYFDILLHPDFSSNHTVYLAYAHGTPEANGTAIMKATLAGDRLENAQQILLVSPLKNTPQHYGGKMLFLPDGTLLLTTGEGFEYREDAQDRESELGKILRINDDGSVPGDNPFTGENSSRVWTYGHRNPQGLALDDTTGTVYMHEHGPRGGDEINVVKAGSNYGWPAVTYGVDYSGAYVSPFTEAEGMTQPLLYWVPSIAPSGMAMYSGEHFPQWQGDLFIGALVDEEVRRVDLENGEVVGQESLFAELESRIRDVRMGTDGHLYILTDGSDGQLIRVAPL